MSDNNAVVIVGTQWGDEGKGKIVDWLSAEADIVVRFQGGHNAGHTLVVDGNVYKLSLLPSGIVRGGKVSVIGNGVVIDPWALRDEMARIREQGIEITLDNLKIADNATLILPVHGHLDRAMEEARGTKKIGTTGRGIGPSYVDKVARRAIRVGDLADDALVREKIDNLLFYHNALMRGFGMDEITFDSIYQPLQEIKDLVLAHACPVWRFLADARKDGKKILFEGAQGAMLDIDHGTYPFVTSSNTIAPQAATGTGTGAKDTGYVIGITKAYTTRVGSGPFPTELFDEIGDRIGEAGHEFGTVTGRKRRCGWFDAVMVKQALTLCGVDGIALMKLDVLDGLEALKICTGYRLNGKEIDYFPSTQNEQDAVEPIYEDIAGWTDTTVGCSNYDDLPDNAKAYISRLEDLVGVKIIIVSTSPERNDTIKLYSPFAG